MPIILNTPIEINRASVANKIEYTTSEIQTSLKCARNDIKLLITVIENDRKRASDPTT